MDNDPLKPRLQLLVKLGSLVVHHEEAESVKSHPLDRQAVANLRNAPEVADWFDEMNRRAFLPVKR